MKRPLKFKLDSFRFYHLGMAPVAAFAAAGLENKCSLSGCMTNKQYASSYMSDDIRRFLRNKIISGDQFIVQYFIDYGISINLV